MRAVDPPPDGGYFGLNTAAGDDALFSLTTGTDNTAIGFGALHSTTTGKQNTANGSSALYANTTGIGNTANGYEALFSNTTGFNNTANGGSALESNTTGIGNTANGSGALASSITGNGNTADGENALFSNTTGSFNTANGASALEGNTTGTENTAIGDSALFSNTTGINNTASGFEALQSNTSGNYNTAGGQGALSSNTIGSNNAALGQNALLKNTTGSSNIAIGSNAGGALTTGTGNIDIGNRGVAGESQVIRVGKTQTATYIAGISGATVAGGIGVVVDTTGHLGTTTSSARYKDNIQPRDTASEAILSLQPVSFRYKKALDPEGIRQFGLVAEQVAKVNPDLVARDDQGKPYSVRYEAVNAMLLNEFLKEHRKVEEQATTITQVKATGAKQDATISRLESVVVQQQKEIAALTWQFQTVRAELDASKPAPRLVTSD